MTPATLTCYDTEWVLCWEQSGRVVTLRYGLDQPLAHVHADLRRFNLLAVWAPAIRV